jgi:dTDP-4-amino-4,6-dideoxygalactose transaminase
MVLMNDFKSMPEGMFQEQMAAVERVFKSGWYILGKEVEAFEKSWAAFCGASYCVGVGNGMDALEIGLRSSGIGVGDAVITTPITAFATVLAIIRAGASPVFADIEPHSALLDLESVKRCITPKTKAVLLVHLYGQIRNMDAWVEVCRDRGIRLLEDCAQAHGSRWNKKTAGTFGEWGGYSFYPTKNLGTLGDGGAIITDSQRVYEKARILRNYGQSTRYHHPELGFNSRLDELHAAILTARLGRLDPFNKRRREIADAYFGGIQNPLICLLAKPENLENHVYHLFVITCRKRDALSRFLRENGVENLIHYPVPCHLQRPCANYAKDPHGLKNTEIFASECLSIPCHPSMTDDEVGCVIDKLNAFR